MPIDTKHPYYDHYKASWLDARHAFEGQRAVKDAGVLHLPMLSGQTVDEYNAYKARALFYSITSKTLSALVGMMLDQPPILKYPEKMKPYFEDHSGVQFYELFTESIIEVLLMGRFGVLVDRPEGGGAPYPVMYPTESIINWDYSPDGKLNLVVLQETYLQKSQSDKYESEVKTRYRELVIEDGRLVIKVHEQSKKGEPFSPGNPTTIENTGIVMDAIPFVCVTPTGLNICPEKPPMMDIVDINYSHYRTSADLEHGRHFTGLPTPYITGGETNTKLHIGSTTAWVVPDANAKVGYLEFTGQGLQSLEKALAEKQSQLASLSARLIDNSTRGSEAAETVRLRYLSETSSLKTTTRAVQAFLNAVYGLIAVMEGFKETDVNITLSTDFLDTKMSAAELKAWVEAYLSMGISKEIFIHALKKGRALPPPGESMGVIPDPPKPTEVKPTPSTTP